MPVGFIRINMHAKLTSKDESNQGNGCMRWSHVLSVMCALVLAAVLGTAGVIKVGTPDAFIQAVTNFQIVEGGLAQAVGFYVPWLEITLSVGLLWPSWRRSSAKIAGGLLILFTLVLVSADLRGLKLDCGCFGEQLKAHSSLWLYARNTVMLLLAWGASLP